MFAASSSSNPVSPCTAAGKLGLVLQRRDLQICAKGGGRR